MSTKIYEALLEQVLELKSFKSGELKKEVAEDFSQWLLDHELKDFLEEKIRLYLLGAEEILTDDNYETCVEAFEFVYKRRPTEQEKEGLGLRANHEAMRFEKTDFDELVKILTEEKKESL